MPINEDCRWFANGPMMKTHWTRLWWDVRHIFDFKTLNPHHEQKPRIAIHDITHAFTNIPVEWCEACYYRAGHMLMYVTMLLVLSLGINVAFMLF